MVRSKVRDLGRHSEPTARPETGPVDGPKARSVCVSKVERWYLRLESPSRPRGMRKCGSELSTNDQQAELVRPRTRSIG